MPEVFIAYKREDSDKATFIRAKLEALGVTVFHDVDIGQYGGDTCHYSKIIDRQLADARAVVVLWTKEAVASDFVRGEADKGWKRKVLVPAHFGDIDPQDLPVPHSGLQTHDLRGWLKSGRCKSDRECCNFLKSLGDRLGRPALPLLAQAVEDGDTETKRLLLRDYPSDCSAKQLRLDVEQDERRVFKELLGALQAAIDADVASKADLLAEFKADFEAQIGAFKGGDNTIIKEPEKRIVNSLPGTTAISDAQANRSQNKINRLQEEVTCLRSENDGKASRITKMLRTQRVMNVTALSAAIGFFGLLGFSIYTSSGFIKLRADQDKLNAFASDLERRESDLRQKQVTMAADLDGRESTLRQQQGAVERQLTELSNKMLEGKSVIHFKSPAVLCDALAAYEYDPDRPASSGWVGKHDKIAAGDAESVCDQAVRSTQDGPIKRRLLVQLGRAKAAKGYYAAAAGDTATAKQLYADALDDWKFAAELGSGQANVVLGAYYRGSFAPSTYADTVRNSAFAWKYYWRAAELKNPFGLTMAAFYLLFPEDYDNAVQPNYSKAKEYLDLAGPSNLTITTLAQGLAKFHGRGYEPADQVEGIRLISSAACKGEGDAQMFFNKYRNYKQLPCSL